MDANYLKVLEDVSPAFVWNRMDAEIGTLLVKYDNHPSGIKVFRNNRQYLTDYAYWFYLSTLWVQRSGSTDINEWKRLFSSDRPDRERCIMKPSELKVYNELPEIVQAYRVHRPGEKDWIAYTLNIDTAIRFAIRRGVMVITEYELLKADIMAYFSRRGEYEIIVLDKDKAKFVCEIDVINKGG